MSPFLFQDESAVERIRHLESNAADIVEAYNYERLLTDEDVADEQAAFAELHIEIARLEAEKRETLEALNHEIKTKRKVADAGLVKIKTRREDVTETVYMIRDEEAQVIGTYNQDGVLIAERPMRAAERTYRMKFRDEDLGDKRKVG